MKDIARRLLTAMVGRSVDDAPLADDVRYTENGQTLQPGDGLWGTLTSFAGKNDSSAAGQQLHFHVDLVDAVSGDAVYFGASQETNTPGMLCLRLRSRNGRISQIEAIAVRLEQPGERGGTVTLFQPSLLTHFDPNAFADTDQLFGKPAATTTDGATRMKQLVESYFDALERGDSRGVRIAENCVRRENGVLASLDPSAAPLNPEVPAYRPFALSCAAQINSGFFQRIRRIRDRRHIAVDVERGLVLTVALFDQPGSVRSIQVAGAGTVALPSGYKLEEVTDPRSTAQFYVKRYEPNFRVPMTELTVQLTKIESDVITRIESIARGAPFGLRSGWPA